jgi:hypothetical protein
MHLHHELAVITGSDLLMDGGVIAVMKASKLDNPV